MKKVLAAALLLGLGSLAMAATPHSHSRRHEPVKVVSGSVKGSDGKTYEAGDTVPAGVKVTAASGAAEISVGGSNVALQPGTTISVSGSAVTVDAGSAQVTVNGQTQTLAAGQTENTATGTTTTSSPNNSSTPPPPPPSNPKQNNQVVSPSTP